MSRILKFRVWGIKQQRYLATNDGANYQLYPTYEECREKEMNRGIGFRPLGRCVKEVDRFIVEQFTGLTDSKGVEIYEGDIVHVNGKYHAIEWRAGGFAATWSDYHLNSIWFMGGEPHVAGNIHEHPHLLT